MNHCYDFPRPVVSVDGVVFGFDPDSSTPLKVLLIKRGGEPFKGQWALPGGMLEVEDGTGPDDQGEDLEMAARRELEEETGAKVTYLEQLYTFGTPGRDPRNRVISVAYFALVRVADFDVCGGDDAEEAQWFSVFELLESELELAFDHREILKVALQRLQGKIQYAPVGFDLLPKRFTLKCLQRLYEAILGQPFDTSNFRKRVLHQGLLVNTGPIQDWKGKGKAPILYSFNQSAYELALQYGCTFEMQTWPKH